MIRRWTPASKRGLRPRGGRGVRPYILIFLFVLYSFLAFSLDR